MDLQTLALLGEFLGGLGVIVSLLYLAFQLRSNSRGLQSESYGRSLERMAVMQERLSQDSAFSKTFSEGLLDPTRLSPQERIQFTWCCTEMFGAFEYMHYQQAKGQLPEEIWARWLETIKFWLSFPGIQAWWQGKPTPFASSFSALVESCIAGGYQPPNPGAFDKWIASGTT